MKLRPRPTLEKTTPIMMTGRSISESVKIMTHVWPEPPSGGVVPPTQTGASKRFLTK